MLPRRDCFTPPHTMLRKPLHPQARYLARWLVALMVFVNLHSALAATLVLAMGAGGVDRKSVV